MTKMTPRDIAWRARILNCPEFDCAWRNSTVCYGCKEPGRQPMRPKEEVVEVIVRAAVLGIGDEWDPTLADHLWREVVSKELDPLYEKADFNNNGLRFADERLEALRKDLRIETEGREAIAQQCFLLERKLRQKRLSGLMVPDAFVLCILSVFAGYILTHMFGG